MAGGAAAGPVGAGGCGLGMSGLNACGAGAAGSMAFEKANRKGVENSALRPWSSLGSARRRTPLQACGLEAKDELEDTPCDVEAQDEKLGLPLGQTLVLDYTYYICVMSHDIDRVMTRPPTMNIVS